MLKKIDFDSGKLHANGKDYSIQTELSINRFKVLEELEVEFYYGFTMQEMFDKLKEAWNLLDKGKMAQAPVKLHNLMTGIAEKVDKREPVMLRICSLFIVTQDEDVNSWSEELAKEKIDDWSKEGYDINDFFSLAANLVPGFIKDYNETLKGTFLAADQEQEKPQDNENSTEKKKHG